MPATLEVCVDNAAGVLAAEQGDADRIELCSALDLGGLTPSRGLMQFASRVSIPTYGMIRPRNGSFHFSPDEVEIMGNDIAAARECGLAGVVLGALDGEGGLDIPVLARLAEQAHGLGLTLHRAIDLVPDPLLALDQAIALGFERVLTSGQARTAPEGVTTLARMQAHAAGRIEVMAGSGVSAETVGKIAKEAGIWSFHASCGSQVAEPDKLVRFGFSGPLSRQTDPDRVRQMKVALARV